MIKTIIPCTHESTQRVHVVSFVPDKTSSRDPEDAGGGKAWPPRFVEGKSFK